MHVKVTSRKDSEGAQYQLNRPGRGGWSFLRSDPEQFVRGSVVVDYSRVFLILSASIWLRWKINKSAWNSILHALGHFPSSWQSPIGQLVGENWRVPISGIWVRDGINLADQKKQRPFIRLNCEKHKRGQPIQTKMFSTITSSILPSCSQGPVVCNGASNDFRFTEYALLTRSTVNFQLPTMTTYSCQTISTTSTKADWSTVSSLEPLQNF